MTATKETPYNYETFDRSIGDENLHFSGGPRPGEKAPDFELPNVRGGCFRLSVRRGKQPVLLTFGSITCPMTAGARPALLHLFDEYIERVEVVTVYVREAHPGENYPHHTSLEQKKRHASDWVELDRIPWTVVVDSLDGRVDRRYGAFANAAYLIGRSGRVAFRALWAGQEKLLRTKIEELLEREAAGEDPVLGEQENLLIPLLHGTAEFDHAIARGGEKAKEDFRRAFGNAVYALQKIGSQLEPVINPVNRSIE
ncbi:MAG TPA: deiodinase-like protein [Thermoanaerobaculia bacterium]|nr:deiodinase-like protein [Thermoanaerobaculia bacterium]